MSQPPWSWTLRRQLPSRCGAHLELMEEILAQLEQLGWQEHDLFGVQMALEESLTNAIRHGNRLDESLQVDVECRASPQRFWLRVEDQGNGFLPSQVPNCTNQENLDACGGRGLLLIHSYMTTVEYNDRGNCVTMEKIRNTATNRTEEDSGNEAPC